MQKGDWKRKKKKEKHRQRKRAKREETELYRLPKKNDRCANFRLSIYVSESFYYPKVNPVLYTHALQIILFGPFYVRTQHCYGSLQIASSQYI